MQPLLTIPALHPYPIYELDGGWLAWLQSVANNCTAIIVDANVLQHYPNIANFAPVFAIPAGEHSKSRQQKACLEDQLFKAGCNRDCQIIAIGGGVTLDLAGFVAATFCRGIPVTYVPTSLLAMVDVCVGGKTGINTEFGKNTLGTFSSPQQVMIDTQFLTTLPKREFCAGIVESLKHGLIADPAFFYWHEAFYEPLIALSPTRLRTLVLMNLKIKSQVVQCDEFERQGIREILNVGHTIGHALEICSHYELNHGEAVALGILAENHISETMGILEPQDSQLIGEILNKFNCLHSTSVTNIQYDAFIAAIKRDKKQSNSDINCILLQQIGQVHQLNQQYCVPLASDLLIQALSWLQQQSANGFCQFK